MHGIIAVLLLVLVAAGDASALTGPRGTSDDKVLVIGTDGTRFDKVEAAIAAGRAPHLAAMRREGFLVATRLPYSPPEALTLSEVGWTTIATGVGPAKHGVRGYALNHDPGQATKNGYLDFLSRLEAVRPALSTFLASDWPNIGLHENGGPIFGDAIDARFALAAADSPEAYEQDDQRVADTAARYLREGNPDAGFVYFGLVDETAHAVGSATPAYLTAIEHTDRRIGQLLTAIRARRTFRRERWTILLTTDHGQQDLSSGSAFSHGGPSDLEETSFVGATGFGIGGAAGTPGVVDIAPTVLARLGLPVDPAWKLDGRALFGAAVAPAPLVSVKRARRRATVVVRALEGSPPLRRVIVRVAAITATDRVSAARRLALVVPARARDAVRVTVVDVDGHRTAVTAKKKPRVREAS